MIEPSNPVMPEASRFPTPEAGLLNENVLHCPSVGLCWLSFLAVSNTDLSSPGLTGLLSVFNMSMHVSHTDSLSLFLSLRGAGRKKEPAARKWCKTETKCGQLMKQGPSESGG